MIVFDAVSFARADVAVLRDVSLEVAEGEVVALVGRSGSGKTTLLRLVNRMLALGGGRLTVGGKNVADWDAVDLRRRTGYAIQDVGLFPHWTVAENIATVPRLLQWPLDRIRARVDELLAMIDLPPDQYRDRWPDQLSGGQRQRVGLARALGADPPVVLMDEPFGAVDPITRVEIQREFLRLQRQAPRTVLLVTHDLDEALALGDRVAVLAGGRLAAVDRPDAIVQSTDPAVRQLFDTRLRPHA
jgi:osmoprotectant transport system ATP-binding protein